MIVMIIYLFILGSALGSFSLVLAWRMHDKKDWIRGRSKCDSCGHALRVKDLIPLYSYISLRGRCRYCKKTVSLQVLYAELGLGIALAVSWFFWPYALSSIIGYALFATWAVCSTVMSALFWYDLRWYKLPSKLIYSLLGLVLVFTLLRYVLIEESVTSLLVYPLLAALLLSGFFAGLFFASSGKWIGFGDVRLALPLGLLVGSPLNAWIMLFIASVLGVILALPALITGSKKLTAKIPFGPLLIIATAITILSAENIVSWYSNLAGF